MRSMDSRDVTTNPRTGLQESWNDFYNVPLVHQKSVGTLRFNGQATAVHTAPIRGGLTFDFFAQLKASDELVVTFPGAARPGKNIYPLFNRVATFRDRVPAVMAFADPTINMDPDREVLLSWFLGGPDLDPAALALQAIRKAQGKTGAKHVVFVGGSGGGFPALRMASMVPGSMAYIHEGTTSIARTLPVSADRYFSRIWPGWDQQQLLQAFPERFDMVRHYRAYQPDNFVYFAQSVDDTRFHDGHYVPLKEAMGVAGPAGASRSGTRHFELYKGEVKGHGKVTPKEFRQHFGKATRLWREYRAARAA